MSFKCSLYAPFPICVSFCGKLRAADFRIIELEVSGSVPRSTSSAKDRWRGPSLVLCSSRKSASDFRFFVRRFPSPDQYRVTGQESVVFAGDGDGGLVRKYWRILHMILDTPAQILRPAPCHVRCNCRSPPRPPKMPCESRTVSSSSASFMLAAKRLRTCGRRRSWRPEVPPLYRHWSVRVRA